MSQPNLSPEQIAELKSLIEGAELSLQQAKRMLGMAVGETNEALARKASAHGSVDSSDEGQVIEGVFDGQHMIGPDGKQYSVPANYASKSKLVEGDLMKLTIGPSGNFMYKQIGPIERVRLKGDLVRDEETQEWRVVAEGRSYKVILASVTYFKGEEGDEVTIMVPKDKSSVWAAVENIIKAGEEGDDMLASKPSSSGFTPAESNDAPSTPPRQDGEQTMNEEPEPAAPELTPVTPTPTVSEPAPAMPSPEPASTAGSSNDSLYATPVTDMPKPEEPQSPAPGSGIPSTFNPAPSTPQPSTPAQTPPQPGGYPNQEEEQPVQQAGNYGALTFDDDDEFDKI